jgi:hypothetical protein
VEAGPCPARPTAPAGSTPRPGPQLQLPDRRSPQTSEQSSWAEWDWRAPPIKAAGRTCCSWSQTWSAAGRQGKSGEAPGAGKAVLLAMGNSGGWLRRAVGSPWLPTAVLPCHQRPLTAPRAQNPATRLGRSQSFLAQSFRADQRWVGAGGRLVNHRLTDRRQRGGDRTVRYQRQDSVFLGATLGSMQASFSLCLVDSWPPKRARSHCSRLPGLGGCTCRRPI